MNEIENSYGLILSDSQLDFLYNYPQGFNRMKCFVTFLKLAVKEPTHYVKGKFEVDLTPGQFAISEVELARVLKCNRKTAGKMAVLFHNAGLVTSFSNAFTTIFTIPCLACWYVGDDQIKSKVYSRHHVVTPRTSIVRKNNKPENDCNVQEPIDPISEEQHEQSPSVNDSLQVAATCNNGDNQDIQNIPSEEPISNDAHVHAKDDQTDGEVQHSHVDGNADEDNTSESGDMSQITHPSTQEEPQTIVDTSSDNSSGQVPNEAEKTHDVAVGIYSQDATPDETKEANEVAVEDSSDDSPIDGQYQSNDVA